MHLPGICYLLLVDACCPCLSHCACVSTDAILPWIMQSACIHILSIDPHSFHCILSHSDVDIYIPRRADLGSHHIFLDRCPEHCSSQFHSVSCQGKNQSKQQRSHQQFISSCLSDRLVQWFTGQTNRCGMGEGSARRHRRHAVSDHPFHSFIHSFIPSFIPSFIHSFLHSLIRSFLHSFIRSFVHSFIRSFKQSSLLHWLIHFFIHPFILSATSLVQPFISFILLLFIDRCLRLKWLGSNVFTGPSRIYRFKICLSLPITSFRAFYHLMKDSLTEWVEKGIVTTVDRHLKAAGYSDVSDSFYFATHPTSPPTVTITFLILINLIYVLIWCVVSLPPRVFPSSSSSSSSSTTYDLPKTVDFTFDGEPVHLTNLDCLQPPQFLNDSVIHFITKYILRCHHLISHRVFVFDTQLWAKLKTPGTVDAQHLGQTIPKKKPKNFFNFEYLFIPANIVAYHWYFMVVIFNHANNTGTIVPMDSNNTGVNYSNDHQRILCFLNEVRASSTHLWLVLV